MKAQQSNFPRVYKLLNQSKNKNYQNKTPYIDTLNGRYCNLNVLEGFRKNTELLCNENDQNSSNFDDYFQKLCSEDNNIIMHLATEGGYQIPSISLQNLKDILFKKLKPGKACDIFHLTVEHLRFCGDSSLSIICQLINLIINDLSCLSSPELNTAIASVIHKGKDKPVTEHKSYRLVRVTPILARLLDEHIRPHIVSVINDVQNTSQYGFTENMTYLMGALQRHECEKFCLDMKKTC